MFPYLSHTKFYIWNSCMSLLSVWAGTTRVSKSMKWRRRLIQMWDSITLRYVVSYSMRSKTSLKNGSFFATMMPFTATFQVVQSSKLFSTSLPKTEWKGQRLSTVCSGSVGWATEAVKYSLSQRFSAMLNCLSPMLSLRRLYLQLSRIGPQS